MAEHSGLSARATVKRVGELTAQLIEELSGAVAEVAAMSAGSGPMLEVFDNIIRARIAEVHSHANDDGGYDEPDELAGDAQDGGNATAYRV